jgi:hypothetical protein
MILFFGLPIITILVMCIIHGSYSIEELRLHWNEYRCNPAYMPFAGYIRPDTTTEANFNYCMNSFGSSIFGFIIDAISSLFKDLLSSLNELIAPLVGFRMMFSRLRAFMLSMASQTFGKIANSMSSMSYILIKIRDIMKRFVGEGYITTFLAITGIDFIVSFVEACISVIKAFVYALLAISIILALFQPELLALAIVLASLIAAAGF